MTTIKRLTSNYLLKGMLVLVCLSLMSMPVSAQAVCVAVATPTLSTPTATTGTWLGIDGMVSNCSSKKVRYTVVVSATDSCGTKIPIASSRLAFGPGQSLRFGISWPVPSGTCAGPCTVTVEAYSGLSVLGRASATFTIY